MAVLVLAQVTWWAWNFLDQVTVLAELRSSMHLLRSSLDGIEPSVEELRQIDVEAYRRRLMFISESAFFAVLTLWALFLLYRALRREETTQQLQKDFIEIVSHESKTPLTALKLQLEDLREGFRADSEKAEDIEISLEELRRIISAFEKMLTLNRTERQALHVESIDIRAVVDSVLRRLQPLLRKHQVHVVVEPASGSYAWADRSGLETAIQCLVENSVLHNPGPDRRLWLSISERESCVTLRIRDNGPGVSQDEQEIIFEKFQRGSRGRTTAGSGLGLYIARKIARAHRGMLRLVESSANGSTFELDLPAVSA
jgi:signal transduction histidine kinase